MNTNYKILFLSFLLLNLLILGCSDKPPTTEVSLEGYHLEDGFELDLVAAEPLIQSPIAMDFDNQGRIWALEMPGYMPNIDGTGEEEPVGRVMILEDNDGDGYFEKAKTFLDGLVLGRAIKLAYGGLLYAEPPNLWFVEINGDRPGKKTLVDPEYAVGGNVEHQPNGLDLNIDNWIYSAKGVFRYRLKDGNWLRERTSFRGQWGITHDDAGRLFYNDNSNPLYGDFVLPNQLNQNPLFKNKTGENEVIVKDRRVYPLQATAVNRGYIDGMLDERNFLKNFTSACGPVIYRGDHFPAVYQGNAFVCGPEANLIKRLKISATERSITGEQAYEGKEFLISEDEAFRPVNLYNGPDAALYIVDYHHGIIQHKVYLTAYLRELYLERGLDTIVNYGRILRVRNGQEKTILLHDQTSTALVDYLNHPNGWIRDRAQQMLIDQQDAAIIPSLKSLAISPSAGPGAIHAIWTLEGLDALDTDLLTELAKSEFPERIVTAIQQTSIFKDFISANPFFDAALAKDNFNIDQHLAMHAMTTGEKAFVLLETILDRHPKDPTIIEAALSGLAGKEKQFHYFLTVIRGRSENYPILNYLETIIQKKKQPPSDFSVQTYTDTKTAGLKLYRQHCAACHGENGMGNKNLAPPIYDSEYIKGDPQKLILLVLHGLQGPVTVKGQRYQLNAVMPGLKDNSDLSDQDIANILTYVRNAFSNENKDVKAKEVKTGRGMQPKGKMYTEEELGMGKR